MHFGLFSLLQQRDRDKKPREIYAEMVEQVKLAEDTGYEIAWFAEHHFSNYCVMPSPMSIVHYMAPQTSRIKLGPAVIVAPLYEPMRMLEDIAVADNLTDGRLVLGFGSGYQQYEFHKFGVDLKNSKQIFHETLELVEQFMSGSDAIEYDGEFIKAPETHFIVRPLQKRMDMYIAGQVHDQPMQKHIAEMGYVPFVTTGWSPIEDTVANRAKIVETREAAGLPTDEVPFAAQVYVHVTDSKEDALVAADNARYVRRIAMSMRGQYAELDGAFLIEAPAEGEPPLETIVQNALIGSPEKIAEQLIARIKAWKPTHLNTFHAPGNIPHKKVMGSIERFMTEVVPLVEKELGPLSKLGAPVPAGPRALAAE
ncbi:MAG: LLM class flavin-dependent oxidoreductase [Rhodospirillaceae bacterium]|jgi:alkanesulfonate monooxygenase SsuD/methylene tetrahydromethanopterin reductase-like flavin-dependent oxidoreductase (luciferase family)|nr:LLM class flavin-dependent oxidoreductase [Rhodospirillaceae bacterium]MBT6118281.1 LLM class flavin-dependent oxidoreductase [Rhodospirillaceae bacterium]